MMTESPLPLLDSPGTSAATLLVIAGAAGDLTWRKLIPALYDLHLEGWLSPEFSVIGIDRVEMDEGSYRAHLREGVNRFSRHRGTTEEEWNSFSGRVTFVTAEFGAQGAFTPLAGRLAAQEKKWGLPAHRIFYLAVPPMMVEMITEQMSAAGLCTGREDTRVVFEKPFGRDLRSASSLNASLMKHFRETQIYRIDHYLGKETVQNILALRFANGFLEPIWDRRYIDHVQITVAEEVGVEHRGAYYEKAGALRDMIQNHLLQILCLVAMEPPVSFQAEEVRARKTDVLHAVRPIPSDRVQEFAVRGQYGEGWIRGEKVAAYRREKDVGSDSGSETFAALKLFIDNWRWQDVPFYLRTGKRLMSKTSEVSIQFRPVPHQAFPAEALSELQPNRLVIRIQPEEGISLRFQAKQPGLTMRLRPVDMRFRYREAFGEVAPAAYETLLLDVLRGDATLFMRADQVSAAWSVIMPVLEAWEAIPPIDFPNYRSGTWGPESAGMLIARDGRGWFTPPVETEGGDNQMGIGGSGP